MLIEFTGMVGSGKSTLAVALKRLLREEGLTALAPSEASMRCLQRSPLGRALARVAPASWRERLMRGALRVAEVWHRLAFALGRPQLSWRVLCSQRRRDIPWWHRRLIVGLFFEVAGRYRFLRTRLSAREVVIFEEGFWHRAINLYAWEPRQLDPASVAAYFSLLPALDLVALIRAPRDACLERAGARGLPMRLRDKDRRTIDRFMAHSDAIVELAAKSLVSQNRAMIQIDNGGTLEDGLSCIREHISTSRAFLECRASLDWTASSAHPQNIGG